LCNWTRGRGRVIAAEGHQPSMETAFRYLLRGNRGFLEISIVLTDPVACAFTFVLEWPAHSELFELILMQEQVLFTTQMLGKERDARVLVVRISRDELEPNLRFWRRAIDGQAGTR
jgi:hypothetical protein